MNKALLALAVGAFAIGTTEFLMMGLLPQVAGDLHVSIARAGYLVSAYALGVVVGAPLLTALSTRFERKHVLLALMGLFTAGHVAIALAPSYHALLAARFATALSHGAFFGTGAVVARSVVPKEKAAQAISLMFLGLTLANVVGVPLGTALGQVVSWRVAFGAVAVLGLATMAALAAWVPAGTGRGSPLRAELAALARPQVLLALAVTTVGTGALFAVYSYVAPILTHVTGFSSAAVVWVLVAYGLGSTGGMLLGGRLGDRSPLLTICASMLAVAVVLAVFTVTSASRVGAVLTLVVFGVVAFTAASPLQNRVIHAAGGAAAMSSAANQAAFNVANALGAFLGAQVLAAGDGYRATMVVGIVLALAGLALAGVSGVVASRATAPAGPGAAPSPALAAPSPAPVG